MEKMTWTDTALGVFTYLIPVLLVFGTLTVMRAKSVRALQLTFEWDFSAFFGFSLPGSLFIVRDQSRASHATTWWRVGVVFLCFQLQVNIHWMNRPAGTSVKRWALKQMLKR